MFRVLFLVLWFAMAGSAQPRIEGRTEYSPYTLVRLTVVDVPPKTGTLWEVFPPEKADIASTAADRLEFTGPPGQYQAQILLVTVGPDGTPQLKRLTAKVTISGSVPPVPPVPPDPVPPNPPTPTDPFFEALQLAYTADASATKARDRSALASVYRDGAKAMIDNPGVYRTAGEVYNHLKKLSTERVPLDSLKGVRQAIGKELNSVIPTDPDVSIAVDRTRIAANFVKVAGFLEALK